MHRKYFTITGAFTGIGILFAILCTGCNTVTKLEVIDKPVPKPALNLAVTPITLEAVQISVMNIDGNFVYVLDSENFLKDTRNDLKVLNLLREQNAVIEAYKEYYEEVVSTSR